MAYGDAIAKVIDDVISLQTTGSSTANQIFNHKKITTLKNLQDIIEKPLEFKVFASFSSLPFSLQRSKQSPNKSLRLLADIENLEYVPPRAP